jgi:gluconolactonase
MDVSRRNFLTTTGVFAAVAAAAPVAAFAQWTNGTQALSRYPDPGVKALDDRFGKYKLYSAAIERLATGFRWAEGPVWFGDGRYLLFSDIPNNRIVRWDEVTGEVSDFRKPSNFSNGNTRDRQGRLVTCEHETRRVTRTEYDGSITVLADSFEGKRLNSPNDIVVKSDDSVWFTDPPFGLAGHYEGGSKTPPELPQNVYRVDGKTKKITVVAGDIKGPNGLCFSPDESKLYIIEGRAVPNRLILAYDVVEGGTKIANKKTLIDCGKGISDGMRCDVDGNLWIGYGGGEGLDGVAVFAPDGKQIGHILTPERVANLTFGGAKRNRLLMCGCQSLYSLYTETQGATIC